MAWRKWFVRLLVFTVVGCCACGVFLYQRFTNPAAIREQVLAKLKTHFAGALVTADGGGLAGVNFGMMTSVQSPIRTKQITMAMIEVRSIWD